VASAEYDAVNGAEVDAEQNAMQKLYELDLVRMESTAVGGGAGGGGAASSDDTRGSQEPCSAAKEECGGGGGAAIARRP
jgi:hypothetical protein